MAPTHYHHLSSLSLSSPHLSLTPVAAVFPPRLSSVLPPQFWLGTWPPRICARRRGQRQQGAGRTHARRRTCCCTTPVRPHLGALGLCRQGTSRASSRHRTCGHALAELATCAASSRRIGPTLAPAAGLCGLCPSASGQIRRPAPCSRS